MVVSARDRAHRRRTGVQPACLAGEAWRVVEGAHLIVDMSMQTTQGCQDVALDHYCGWGDERDTLRSSISSSSLDCKLWHSVTNFG